MLQAAEVGATAGSHGGEPGTMPSYSPSLTFQPHRAVELLRASTVCPETAYGACPRVAALQYLSAVLEYPRALGVAQNSIELTLELFAPLASRDASFRYRVEHVAALRTVLLKLTPHFALCRMDKTCKERIATALVDGAEASDFLASNVCFEILNEVFFALDFRCVCPTPMQERALAVASAAFFRAADAIEMLTTLLPSSRGALTWAAEHAMERHQAMARSAVKEALVFILSSRESVLAAHADVPTNVGRRLVDQPSLSFAFTDAVFDTIEDPHATNEAYVFRAMLQHERFPAFFRALLHAASTQGRWCPERFALQRLLFHGLRHIKDVGCLDAAVQHSVDELTVGDAPNITLVFCACAKADDAAARELALTVYAPILKATIGRVLARASNQAKALWVLQVIATTTPRAFIDACKSDPALEAMLRGLVDFAASSPSAEIAAGVGRVIVVLEATCPDWLCARWETSRQHAHALLQKTMALDSAPVPQPACPHRI